MANICFDCINSVPDDKGHGCPWSERFEPVPGWKAEPTIINGALAPVKSYDVKECPLYEEG